MAKEIKAIIVVEIVGRPAEHVKKSLEDHILKIDKIKGIKLISKKIFESKKLEQVKHQNIFTCFAEAEIECISFAKLIEVIFDFMPSSVEILEPDNLTLDISEATGFLNDLAGRLHRYDEIAKAAQIKNQQLVNYLREKEKNNSDVSSKK